MPITQVPSISIVKNGTLDMTVVDPANHVDVGDRIDYTIIVTNDGNVSLTNVTVSDSKASPLIPQWPGTPGTLLPGQSVIFTGSYTLTQADIIAGRVDNTATAGSNQTSSAQALNEITFAKPSLVPTLGKWGTGLMVVIFTLFLIGAIGLRRRRRTTSV